MFSISIATVIYHKQHICNLVHKPKHMSSRPKDS